MVKLRLRRRGRKFRPFYDIVAVDSRAKRDGRFIERIGYYNPMTTPSTIVINPERALYWLKVGAQPTPRVRHLLSTQGILLRLHMERKGMPQEEIERILEQHREIVKNRVQRILEKKKKRQQKQAKSSDTAQQQVSAETAETETSETPEA